MWLLALMSVFACLTGLMDLRSTGAALRPRHEQYDAGVVHRVRDLLGFGDDHLEMLCCSMHSKACCQECRRAWIAERNLSCAEVQLANLFCTWFGGVEPCACLRV